MLGRLKKAWRFYFNKEEFSLTSQEEAAFTVVLRVLTKSSLCHKNFANGELWNELIHYAYKTHGVSEMNSDDVMKSLAQKLLKQTDWE